MPPIPVCTGKTATFRRNQRQLCSGIRILELARVLSLESPVDATLWFVFFDGEEALVEWSDHDSLYGSRAFVRMLQRDTSLERIGAMILLDLIGGKDLRILKDDNSTDWLN